MKKFLFILVLIFLLFSPQFEAAAQSQSTPNNNIFDMTGFPQWARDMRRFDIIAFGSFPFAIFTVTFITDLFRWNEANGMDFNDMRYAPWPLKSAGAVEMTADEYTRTIWLAAGLSIVLAITDLIIVKVRQNNARRRIESRPASTVNIYREQPQVIEAETGPPETGETEENGEDSGEDGEVFESAAE